MKRDNNNKSYPSISYPIEIIWTALNFEMDLRNGYFYSVEIRETSFQWINCSRIQTREDVFLCPSKGQREFQIRNANDELLPEGSEQVITTVFHYIRLIVQ